MSLEYQWLPDFEPDSPTMVSGAGQFAVLLLSNGIFAGALALPPVVAATGVGPSRVFAIMGAFTAWCAVGHLLGAKARQSRTLFQVVSTLDLVASLITALSFIVLSGDPKSPLWSLPILYAAINGGMVESRPSLVYLVAHVVGPLATWPFFHGNASAWALAGPLSTAAFSAGVFHFMAGRASGWRKLRDERDAAQLRVREQEAELHRLRLARDLHDSVGSTFSLLRTYGDLLERVSKEPDEVNRMAQLIRDAASGGIGDLRGSLEALAPDEATLTGLETALRVLAARVVSAEVLVTLDAPEPALPVGPDLRLAVVRVFQEFVRNAVDHGKAKRVEVRLLLEGGVLQVTLEDDGEGFDPGGVREGRGLAGMKRRAEELGGSFALEAAKGRGTRATFSVPLAAPAALVSAG